MSATFDFTTLAASTDHRDAGLLDLIEQFMALNDHADRLIRRAARFKDDGRAYKRLWAEVLAGHDERVRLERAIVGTKAQTRLGVIAKCNLWIEMHADNAGTANDLPRAAIREAVAMLGEVGA